MHDYAPDKIFDALELAAEERAQAEYEAHLLERHGEILIGELMWEVRQKENCPASMTKEIARTKPKWKVHVDGEAEAIRKRSRARARYENLRVLASARQTEESSRRALTK